MTAQPAHALVPSGSSDTRESWRPILQVSNQVVLYNPTSHALSVNLTSRDLQSRYDLPNRRQLPPPPSSATTHHIHGSSFHSCPYCKQTLPSKFHTTRSSRGDDEGEEEDMEVEDMDHDSGYNTTLDWDQVRAANYFHLLELSNEAGSRPATPPRQGYSSLPPPPSRQGPLPPLPSPLPSLPPPVPPQLSSGIPPLRSTPTPRVRVEVGENNPPSTSFGNGSTRAGNGTRGNGRNGFPAEAMAEGYFKAFFQEEYKLGMGANGSVFLCQHVLDGTPLGHFAVKKIAVGESHSYLLKILREVRLLEQMRHPNIITYHHAWLESYQFSPFGPKVPTLHVLMQWAEGGSLDDFIDVRLGRPTKHVHVNPLARFSSHGRSTLSSLSSIPSTPTSSTTPTLPALSTLPPLSPLPTVSPLPTAQKHLEDEDGQSDTHSRSARIRAFRAYQKASPAEKERMKREVNEASGVRGSGGTGQSWKAVHLLGAEEVKSLFSDVVEGLAFLHEKSILHLDLKPGNVLLTWDEGKLIPRAMLSDFGTSRDMMNTSRVRSGNTGTLEYSAPESLPSPETGLLRQIDSKADIWSLGMILHKLLFFRLPYRYATDGDTQGGPLSGQEEGEKLNRLENEVVTYPGFKSTPRMMTAFEARRLPRSFLILLETLLNITPPSRPSVERISLAIREGKFNPQESPIPHHHSGASSSALSLSPVVMPVMRRGSTPTGSPLEDPPMGLAADMDNKGHDETERLTSPAPMFAMRDRVKLLGPPEGVAAGVSTSGSGGVGSGEEGPAARWMNGWVGGWMVKNVGRPIMKRLEKTLLGRIAGRITLGRGTGVRMLKSCLLSGKTLMIARACFRNAPGLAGWSALSQPWVLVLLSLALLDTVWDDVWLSVVLLLVHVLVMKIACGGIY